MLIETVSDYRITTSPGLIFTRRRYNTFYKSSLPQAVFIGNKKIFIFSGLTYGRFETIDREFASIHYKFCESLKTMRTKILLQNYDYSVIEEMLLNKETMSFGIDIILNIIYNNDNIRS